VANPTGYQVAAWEAMIEITNAAAYVATLTLTGGTNFGTPPEYIVGCGASPLQPNSVNVIPLMNIDLLILDDSAPIEVYVRPVPGSLSFPDGVGYAYDAGFPVDCFPSTGGFDTPVFRVNGACLVADEGATWGAVKSIYE
jgi:hypothetical protein